MLPQYGGTRGRRKTSCSAKALYWTLLAVLACTAGGAIYCLQGAYKELAYLKESIETSEGRRRGLVEEISLQKQKAAQAETRYQTVTRERDEVSASEKTALSKLAELEKNVSACADKTAQLSTAEGKLAASEKDIKEITVKAGTCQQQFAALNAECATLKQGLANLGLTSQTVDTSDNSHVNQGALDPRGGTEAAKVLRDHSQQPWKSAAEDEAAAGKGSQGVSSRIQVQQPQLLHDGESSLIGTDVDETGPGLEKALAQGGATLLT